MRLATADGLALEAEWRTPDHAGGGAARAVAVLCHPHPQYGGTMRSIVISALFDALPAQGVACLRFNFRGVEASEGAYSEGTGEPLDVLAALDAATGLAPGLPLLLAGWSFGADMALATDDPRPAGWLAIAPPLRFLPAERFAPVAHDARPKLFVLAANDEFRSPDSVAEETRDWVTTRVEVVPGASHFFVGRTERVVALAADFTDGLVRASG